MEITLSIIQSRLLEYCMDESRTIEALKKHFTNLGEDEIKAIIRTCILEYDMMNHVSGTYRTNGAGKLAIKKFKESNKPTDREVIIDTIHKLLKNNNPIDIKNLDVWYCLDKDDEQRIKGKVLLDANLVREAPYNKDHLYYQPKALKVKDLDFDKDGNYVPQIKPKKTYWKTATIIVALIAAYPSYYTIWSKNAEKDLKGKLNEKTYQNESLLITIDSLKILNSKLEHKIDSLSIPPIPIEAINNPNYN